MKTTGAEWKKFITDDSYWNDMWIENWCLTIDGIEYTDEHTNFSFNSANVAVVQINSGKVIGERTGQFFHLKSFFKKWKTKQTTKKFVIETSIQNENKFIELIKNSKLSKIIR